MLFLIISDVSDMKKIRLNLKSKTDKVKRNGLLILQEKQ